MTHEITIRTAKSEDAEDLIRVITHAQWLSINQQAPDRRLTIVRRQLEQALQNPQCHVLVAHHPEKGVVGFVSLQVGTHLVVDGNSGYVSELFVDETCRGQGVGKRLLNAVQQKAMELGCAKLRLINVKETESYRREFYKKNNWTEWGEAAVFYNNLDVK
jgi:ribosomal protein S18 acetylase RimI-like enzyme